MHWVPIVCILLKAYTISIIYGGPKNPSTKQKLNKYNYLSCGKKIVIGLQSLSLLFLVADLKKSAVIKNVPGK